MESNREDLRSGPRAALTGGGVEALRAANKPQAASPRRRDPEGWQRGGNGVTQDTCGMRRRGLQPAEQGAE